MVGQATKAKDLTPEQKSKLTEAVDKAAPALASAVENLKSKSGIGAIVGPTLDSLQGKLKSLI